MKSNKKIEASTRYALLDGISHTRLIQKSDLDWTIVRAPMLTEEPEKGKIEVVNVGQINGFKLSRADLAQLMLKNVLQNIDVVFLLRPPQLADVPKYFTPFIRKIKEKEISKIVFLSVQGAENQKFIPHHKIEKLILEEGLEFIFLRPGYFMQNLTTTLLHEIKSENKIYIPSGNLKFNWVDARDIGLVSAHVLNNFEHFKNKSYEITGTEFAGFGEVAQILTEVLGKNIRYESPGPLQFYNAKRNLGVSVPMIFVMLMLHFLPRFGKNQQRLTKVVEEISGKSPVLLREYIEREKEKFGKKNVITWNFRFPHLTLLLL
jgi:hypothetical protein